MPVPSMEFRSAERKLHASSTMPCRGINYLALWPVTCFSYTRHSVLEEYEIMDDGQPRTGKDWRELCAAASQETDSEKLVSLVDQILRAFDEQYDQVYPAKCRGSASFHN